MSKKPIIKETIVKGPSDIPDHSIAQILMDLLEHLDLTLLRRDLYQPTHKNPYNTNYKLVKDTEKLQRFVERRLSYKSRPATEDEITTEIIMPEAD